MHNTSTNFVFKFSWIVGIIVLMSACHKTIVKDSSKEIISISLKQPNGTFVDSTKIRVLIQDNKIIVNLPFYINRTKLIPLISITGVSISPASGTSQDFTMPVTYTVTAADGSTKVFLVSMQTDNPGGVVFMGSSDKTFYALDALSGTLKWRFTSTASFAYSSATYQNGTVYVGGIDGYVYAFDAISGSVKWKFFAGTDGIESDAVIANGTVYVGSNDDNLYAIDAATGKMKWKFTTGGNVSASPTIANGLVYFGSSDSKLYALDTAAGKLKWTYATGNIINQSAPALSNGIVYVGSRDCYLHAVDAITGALKWRYFANGISLEQSSPIVSNGVVYIGSWYDIATFTRPGSLFAVNAVTGQLVWEKLAKTGIGSTAAVVNGRVYITTDDNNLYALDTTGNTLWKQQILANGASPAIQNGILYIGGGGTRNIYAFDAVTGVEKWRFATPNGLMTSSPLIVTSDL